MLYMRSAQVQMSSLPPSMRQAIFSLVREGLNNVEKHARAQHVRIVMGWSADSLSMDLIDDGVGFDLSSVPDGHYGLAMMHEKAAELGGEMSIDSAHGRGTRLSFRVPLPRGRGSHDDQAAAQVDPHEILQNVEAD